MKAEFRPAAPNSGIRFFRSDLASETGIPATVKHCIHRPRRTTLEIGLLRVEMVEHIMAALFGLQIDNCEVHVNATEMPAADGSSLDAARALIEAGFVVQAGMRPCIHVEKTYRVEDGMSWIEVRPATTNGLRISYGLDYSHVIGIGRQEYTIDVTPTTFVREIAPARTFVLEREALQFQAQGFGKHMSYQDLLVFGKTGPINNALRFPNECVRHKVLDLVGDLALAGCDIRADVRANRSGHLLNAKLVEAIQESHPQQVFKATA